VAFPDKPELDYSYTGFQQSQGNNSFPGTYMDNDLANVKSSVDQIIDFIKVAFTTTGILLTSSLPSSQDLTAYTAAAAASAASAAASVTTANGLVITANGYATAAGVSAASAASYSSSASAYADAAAASAASISPSTYMVRANNLSDVAVPATARSNLGLLALATKATAGTADLSAMAVAASLRGAGSAGTTSAEITMGYGPHIAGTVMHVGSPFGVRQTVAFAPVTSAGVADFLPATSVNLNLTSQNVTSTAPFVVEASNGPVSRVGSSTANLTWTSLTASQTNYLYVDVGADGTLTTGFTILAPVYQQGGTYSTTSGQFTFNIGEMVAKVGNGSVAAQAYRVFVGEAVCSGSAVTSTVMYALRGRFTSTNQSISGVGTSIAATHSLGTPNARGAFKIINITTDLNFAVGDQVEAPAMSDGTFMRPVTLNLTRSTVDFRVFSTTGTFQIANKTTGAPAAITAAKWNVIFEVMRGW
jgi:hypothetical protein